MGKFRAECITDYKKINIEKLSDWMYNWWGKSEGWTKEKVVHYMEHSFNSELLPKTIVVFNENNEEVAMCQVTMHDLSSRPDIYPYLANLYVDVPFRHNGLVKVLLDKALEVAKEFGIKTLYLFTPHENLYDKYDWQQIGYVETFQTPHLQRLYKYELN